MAKKQNQLLVAYNALEKRAYCLDEGKAPKNLLSHLIRCGWDYNAEKKIVLFANGKTGSLPEGFAKAMDDNWNSEAIWVAMKLQGFTVHYSRQIEAPFDTPKKDALATFIKNTASKPELLAIDRTGISPIPLELIASTAMLYGQIASTNAKKVERAQNAIKEFRERVTTYGELKKKMEAAGFSENDQVYRKVRRDYEFLRIMVLQIESTANEIADVKKAANKKTEDAIAARDNALAPYKELKGKAFFRAASAVTAFLVGGSAATYMMSIKNELIAHISKFSTIPLTWFGICMLAAGVFAIGGMTLFDVTVRFIENSISKNASRKLRKITNEENSRMKTLARSTALFALEGMAKYHYVEDVERNSPKNFLNLAVHEEWQELTRAIRKAHKYSEGGFIRHIFSLPSIRRLANARPY